MTRYLLALICLALANLTAAAQNAAAAADSAYVAEDYTRALQLYQEALADGNSATLQYNLGNTWYRLGRPGQAILHYERALRLDPTLTPARENLAFVNSRITDRPGERGTFLSNLLDAAADTLPRDGYAWLALTLFLLAAAGIVLYRWSSVVTVRKAGFFGAIAALVLFAIALFLALRSSAIATDTRQAIVTKSSTILSTAPRAPRTRAEEAILLHEGTRVTILDRLTSHADSTVWLDVEVDNEHRAWINADDVTLIYDR